jgi:hypothetical protein
VPVNIPSKVDYTIEIEGYATGWGGYENPEFRLYAYLTAGNRTLIIRDGNFSSYSWLRGDIAISGATSSSSYTPTADDAGKEITLKVTGYGNTVTSTAYPVPKPVIMEIKWESVETLLWQTSEDNLITDYKGHYTLAFTTPYKYVMKVVYNDPVPDGANDDPITGYCEFNGDLDSGYLRYNNYYYDFTVNDDGDKLSIKQFPIKQDDGTTKPDVLEFTKQP